MGIFSSKTKLPPTLTAHWDDSTHQWGGVLSNQTVHSKGYISASKSGLVVQCRSVRMPYPSDEWKSVELDFSIGWECFNSEMTGVAIRPNMKTDAKPGARNLIFDSGIVLCFFVVEEPTIEELAAWKPFLKSVGVIINEV